MFRKIVCFFRNHNWDAWSNWKYKSINSCERQRVCLRCKKKEVKEEKHVWGTWEYVANSCKQRRKCQQCQHSEIQITEHLWDVWKYISSDVCQQIKVCQRCKAENKEEFRIEHIWGTWKYITQNSCQQEMICQRCGEKKSRTAKHIWGAWDDWKKISYSSCQQIRICERCKETENQIEKHLWNKWKYISLNSCEQEKTCQRCRTRNTRIGKHLWNEWEYISPNSCEQEKTCQRCKTKDSQIGEHLWNEWEYISLNSCKQEKICQQCGAKDTRHVEEYQRVIRTITETILDELAHFNDNFHIESPSARDVFADPDISSYSTLSQIQQEVYRAQFQLQEEPFVAYIKAEIDGQEKILFICRTYTPTELKPLTPLATFVSSRSPMGRIASYEVGNIDIINTPQGRVKVKVIEKNLFKPVKSGLKWDGKENKFSLKSGSYFIKSLVDLAAKEGIKRESIDDFALRDMAILDRTQSDIYTLSNLAIKNGIGRESIDDFALRDMAILDRTQGEIYTLPLSYQIIIEGAPGTGKTTTLIKRIAQKSIPEQNFLHEDDIRRLDRENEMEFFFNKNNWIMFTPTEALKFFLKKALSKELLPNSDNLVRTWDVEQTSLATDVLNIVKYKDKGFYTRTTKKIINAQNNSDLINYAEQFIKFSNAVISNSIQGQVKRAKYINMCVTKIPRQYHSFRLKQLKQAESLLNKQYSQEIKNKEISDQEIDLLIFVMLKNAHEKIFKHRIYKELLNDNLKVLDRIDVLENIKAKYKTQVIVDEATDFSTVQLGCMTYLAHPRYKSVIFAGDLMQRVTALGLSNWEEFRDFIKGFHFNIDRRLQKVYRQRPKLLRIAKRLYKNSVGHNPLFNAALNEDINDPDPLKFNLENNLTKFGIWIADRINEIFIINGDKLPSVAIFVSEDEQINQVYKIIQKPLEYYNIQVKTYSEMCNNKNIFTEKSISEGENKVKVLSVKYLKGLEFEAVFLFDINQIAEKNPELVATYLYTALTRAVSFLAVTYNTNFPESIKFAEKYFKDGNWNT